LGVTATLYFTITDRRRYPHGPVLHGPKPWSSAVATVGTRMVARWPNGHRVDARRRVLWGGGGGNDDTSSSSRLSELATGECNDMVSDAVVPSVGTSLRHVRGERRATRASCVSIPRNHERRGRRDRVVPDGVITPEGHAYRRES